MPRRGELRIAKRTVDGLSVQGKDAVFWDRDLPGFGVRVYPTGRKVYLITTQAKRNLAAAPASAGCAAPGLGMMSGRRSAD